MPYSREIYLDEDTEQRLISYLNEIITNHDAERGPHLDDLLRYQKDYWAKPTTAEATFPFKGAATLIIPLNAIAVEAIVSKTMTTRFALQEIVSAHAVSPDWDQASAPFERFMNRELLDVMKIRQPYGNCILEAVKFGTMIGKVGYERMVKTSVRQVGDTEQEYDIVVKDGADFVCVPDARFLMPFSEQEVDNSPWAGEEHSRSPYEVMQLERGGAFRPRTIIDGPDWEHNSNDLSKLHSWINKTSGAAGFQGGNRFERAQAVLENTQPQWPKSIDWVELKMAWDVDKSENQKEIVVHYHKESQTIMSCRYNTFSDLRKGYRTTVYFPVEHRFRGIGVCKQNEQFQKEITVQHRQRIDNATLANMRMLKVNKLSGYGPKEPVFPGKMWFLDDMSHVETLQLGEIYPSSYSNEQAALTYSQQRTGIGDLQLGQMQVGTPGTATSDLARIQEGNKKSDFFYSNCTEFLSDIVIDVADVIQQFGPKKLAYFDTAENGDLVKKFFDMPENYIREGLLLTIKPSTTQHNKIVDRQNWTQIAPLLQQYYNGLIQLAQLGGMQQLGAIIVQKGMNAATEAMRQILETFDVRNINRIVVTEIENAINDGLQSARSGQNGQGQLAAPGQVPGMDLINQVISGAGQSSNGISNRIPNSQ